MKQQWIFLTFATTLLLSANVRSQEKSDDPKPEVKPVTVPFELLKTQHMVVEAKINGKGPYRLIFDTGAPINLLNNKVAKEAGLFPKNFKAPPFAFFGSMGQFKIGSLEVGDLKAENLNCMVMDHPTVKAISDALGPIEGIVGFTFFAKYRMTLDYQAKTMSFVPVNYRPVDMMEAMMKMIMFSRQERRVAAPMVLVGIQVEKKADDMDPGVTIKEVLAESPAAKAGLKPGDRLLTLDSRWTDSVVDTYIATSQLRPGAAVVADFLRDGKRMEAKVNVRAGI
ncbi:MAG: aspartyl protease family protein [Planctomycetes bacterium]|nr:aspartyl protease family protein [Planctomycetota bacterium]